MRSTSLQKRSCARRDYFALRRHVEDIAQRVCTDALAKNMATYARTLVQKRFARLKITSIAFATDAIKIN